MAPGESFESSSPSSGENFSPWFEDSLDDTEPYENLSGEEIVEQIIAERHRPADPKKVYPEIYGEDYNRDISPKCKTTLESLDKADYFDLIDAYETNYKFGNARLVGYLTKMLGLESRPKIIYKPKGEKDTQTCAYYDPEDNSIVFIYEPGRSKKGNHKDANTTAHEVWHAYQEQCARNGSSDRDYLYDANSRHYVELGKDYSAQLVEREAIWFGNQIEDRIQAAAAEKEDIVTKFRRLKSFDRRHGIKN